MEGNKTIYIELNGLRFFGNYGLYLVERKWHTELIIDLRISVKIPHKSNVGLEDIVDYENIYKVIKTEMQQPHFLLESLAILLIQKIKQLDDRILSCKIKICKKAILDGPLNHVAIELEE